MANKLFSIIGLIFFIFSLLQINDPDAIIWLPIYLIPSLISFLIIFNYKMKFLKIISFFYFILAIYNYTYSDATLKMFIFNEKANESLGLILCSLWIFILSINNKSITAYKL